MPLTAVVDRKTIIAPDLSEREWKDLASRHRKGLPVAMACCGAPGHLRISARGTRHFYHAGGSGCRYAEESKEHLAIKEQIYRICRSLGWETTVEYPSPDRTWIADVYTERDGRRIAFEIQISTIPPDELEARDRRYRDAGIEAYWLLDDFLGRSRDFRARYDSLLSIKDDRRSNRIPYIDPSLFETGGENHLFIAKGIRTAGLRAKEQEIYTTGNPAIPLGIWVREILNGNYGRYLEETAAAFHRKRELTERAAPALFRFRDFYHTVIRTGTYRKKADNVYRISKKRNMAGNGKAIKKKLDELYLETDWIEKEYHSFLAESSGLFIWKETSRPGGPVPFFRLDSELTIRKLRECMTRLDRWEDSFTRALDSLEREMAGSK